MKCVFRFLFLASILVVFAGPANAQWERVFEQKTKKDLNAIYFVDREIGWVAGDSGLIFSTGSGGDNWAELKSGVNFSLSDIFFRDRSEGWMVAQGGRVLYSEDAGISWKEIYRLPPGKGAGASKGDAPELYSVAFVNKKKGWVVGTEGRVLSTEDGGTTWIAQESGTKEEIVHIKFTSEKRGWAVGGAGTILFTNDAGRHGKNRRPTARHISTTLKSWARTMPGQLVMTERSSGPQTAGSRGSVRRRSSKKRF